jgi:Tricorn protease C1 domain
MSTEATDSTATTFSSVVVPSAAIASPVLLDGLWRSDGYGYLISVSSGKATIYQKTNVSCLADPIRTQQGPASTDGTITFSLLGQTTSAFTSKTKDTAGLTQKGSLGEVIFNRIDRLPAQCGAEVTSDPAAAFDIFVNTYSEHYPFFEQRKVDWSTITDTYRPKVTSATTDQELATIFEDMIRPLGDGHTSIFVGEDQTYAGLRSTSTITKAEEMRPLGERFAAAEQKYLNVEVKTWGERIDCLRRPARWCRLPPHGCLQRLHRLGKRSR